MYKQLRVRLTLWYVFLSAFTFIALALIGTALCYESITTSLDESVESLMAHALSLVDETQPGSVKMKAPPDTLRNEWSRARATIQLYSPDGKMISEFGPKGFPHLCRANFSEATFNNRHVRMGSDPLRRDGALVGYLQVETPTDTRDQAVRAFALTLGWLSPVLIFTLAICGYIFSGKASKPVEEAFSLLRQFLADAGHELKTPVHLIQLTAENAMVAHEEDAELQQDLGTIVRATDRLGRLVDDMMTLTKMEVKQLPLKSVTVRLDELLSHALADYGLAAKEKGIELQCPDNLEPAALTGDPDQLNRVIGNLIENALRYTDSGGHVFVRMHRSANSVKFTVQDSGIGIPKESLPLIFNRFYRVDKSRARAAGGTGLGLAIVKAICELHGGTIAVESEEGKGSTFTVSLPAHALSLTGQHNS